MNYLKVVGLAVITALGLLMFSGAVSAAATTRTCAKPPGTQFPCPTGSVIDLSAESSITIRASFANITCTESTIKSNTTNTGSATETVKAGIETLTFTACNGTVTVLRKGTLEIHTEGVTNNNGTLTGSGTEITVATLGTSCVYGTSNTDLGTLTGSSSKSGATATLDLSGSLLKFAGGFVCGSPAGFEGTYTTTEPDWLDID